MRHASMTELILLLASFAVILAGALMFTNAVEWARPPAQPGRGGDRQHPRRRRHRDAGDADPDRRDHRAAEGSEDVAVGAIIGAPFLLATLAMALVGLSAYLFRERREQGLELNADIPTLDRDLIFFLVFFAGAPAGRGRGPRRRFTSRSRSSSSSPTLVYVRRDPRAAAARSRRPRRSAASTWIAATTTSPPTS